ncbi:MAG: hypothetical protein Hyperionvirus6_88 [Hyperionvirus sp.]|uniref:Lipoyl-binding domain-containing protein n=1 Tax=Hyperionvirus sp. TaxID=2487770 RepID=A0A3G5A815_9VIRU|nr:MAG: hypothetical protein Hyperionvirus6_88 [Hyperionvirus sp.]
MQRFIFSARNFSTATPKFKYTTVKKLSHIPWTGYVNSIFIKKGDPIKKGNLIAYLGIADSYDPIFSPVDGIIYEKHVEVNSPINDGDRIVTIAEIDKN